MTAHHLASRAIIRLSPIEDGEDVTAFLQGLVTNDVSGNLPVYAALLSAQGKTMFDFLIWRDGDDILIDCEAGAQADLVKRLSLYRLRRKIAIAADDALAVYWSVTRPDDSDAAADPRLPELGFRWIAPAPAAHAAAHTPSPADDAWLAHRLTLGVTEGQAELSDVLWLETNAAELNGVNFEKGCYIGQENTARMNWRQKVNRRLVVVPLDQSQEKRRKCSYDTLGLAVDHLRLDDISGETAPAWLAAALKPCD